MNTEPKRRDFVFTTIVVGDDAECIALLTQVMQAYPKANHVAIALWFAEAYGPKKIVK